MTSRATVWLHRYLPAELGGMGSALLCAWATVVLTGSTGVAAVAGTCGETLAYYATMLARDLAARDARAFRAVVRDLFIEFGPAEALDSPLLRPTLLYYGMLCAPSAPAGIVAGTLAADCTFYISSIVSFEWLCRKRRSVEELSQ